MNYGHNVLPGLSGVLVLSILAAATATLLLTDTVNFAGFKRGTGRNVALHDADIAGISTKSDKEGARFGSRDNGVCNRPSETQQCLH